MKNKNFLKKLTAGLLGFVMTLGVGAAGYSASAGETKAAEKTSTLTFTQKCGGSGTAKLDDSSSSSGNVAWTVTSDAAESDYDGTSGIHYGTNSKSVKYINLTTSDFSDYTIKKIVVVARDAKGSSGGSVSVTVGSTSFTTTDGTGFTANSNKTFNFTGSASGDITVSIARTSAQTKAMYCKSIIVTYDEGGSAKTLTSISISGNMSKTTYTTDDAAWDFSGLTATGTYDSGDPENITSKVTWTPTPSAPAENTTSVSVVASIGSVSSAAHVESVTVTKPSYIKIVPSNLGNMSTSRGNISDSYQGISFVISDGLRDSGNDHLRIYSGSTFSISASKNMEKIELTCKNSTGDYNPSFFSSNPATYTTSGNVGTWTGSAKSVTFSASAQVRVTEIKVYYEQEKTVSSIAVKTAPTKTEYEAGDNFNAAGLVITVTYEGGSTADISYDDNQNEFGFSPSTNLAEGTTSVTITYKTKTCTQAITVTKAKEISSITLSGPLTKTTYYNGETVWDKSGLTVTGNFDDGGTVDVTTDAEINFDTSTVTHGQRTITASYHSMESTLTVNINVVGTSDNPMTVAQARAYIDDETAYSSTNNMYVSGKINALTENPYNEKYHSMTYYINDTGDYDDEVDIYVYSGRSLNNTDFNSANDLDDVTNVTIVGKLKDYNGTKEFDMSNYIVAWDKPTAISIAIKTDQTKTAYNVGDEFDATGLVITVSYDTGTTEDVAYADDPDNFSFSTVGSDGKVTITYSDLTCEQTVILLVIENITGVATSPETVGLGKTIDPSAVVLNATYNTGGTTTVHPDSVTVDTSTLGDKTATATYESATGVKSATFTVTVVNEPESVTVKISDVATANGWNNSSSYPTFTASGFTFAATQYDNNTKYYSSDNTWRFYSNDKSGITITPNTTGVKIKSVTSNADRTWTIATNGSSASCPVFTASTSMKSFTIEYYPPVMISKINLTDGETTVSSLDENPSITLAGKNTVLTAGFEPSDSLETLSWTFTNGSNLSFASDTHTVTVTDLTSNANGTLEVKSKNVTLSVSLIYNAPAKVVDSISVKTAPNKTGYVIGECYNPTGLVITVTYTNSTLYPDVDVAYSGNESKFSFNPSTNTPLTLEDGETSKKINVYITYTDENDGSATNGNSIITVNKEIKPVSDIEFTGRVYLDVYDHTTANINAEAMPKSATDRGLTYLLVDDEKLDGTAVKNKASDYITIDSSGNVTVKDGITVPSDGITVTVRATTTGTDQTGNHISKDKDIYIRKHQINGYKIAEVGQEAIDASEFTAFEYGKTYEIEALDNYFPDDQDCTWAINNGLSYLEIKSTNGTKCTVYCKGVSGTTNIQISAKIHDSATNNLTRKSVYQSVSTAVISADKTELYTNNTATITLATNEFSRAENVAWDISDPTAASVSKATDTTYTVSFAKAGNITIKAIVDGVPSNIIDFNVCTALNDIRVDEETTSSVSFTKTDFADSESCTKDGVTLEISGMNTGNWIKILGTGGGGGSVSFTTAEGLIQSISSVAHNNDSTKNVGFDQASVNQSSISYSNPNSKQWELDSITVTVKKSININLANDLDHFMAQAKVIEFANYLNGLSSISLDNWIGEDGVKSNFDATVGTLTGDELAFAMNMLKYADASNAADSDCLQQAMKRYDDFVKNYNLLDSTNNFLGRTLTATPHTVTFLDQDGTTLGTDTTVVYGEKPSYTGSTPTKESTTTETYSFVGWSTNKNAQAGDADVFTSANLPELNNVEGETYYAIYSSSTRTYSLAFDNNGGGTVPSAVTGIEYNGSVDLTEYTATNREGYEFVGWSTTADGKNMVTSITLTADNTKVYAVWNQLYKAQYLTTDSTSGTAPTDPTWYKVDALVEVQGAGTLAKDGYRFGGWELNGTVYAPGEKFIMPEGGAELTPVWNKLYIASYNVGDIEVGKYVSGETFTLPDGPAKDGYTFVGWSDGTTLYLFNGDENPEYTMGSKDVTFVAKYHNNNIDYIEVTSVSGDAFFYYEQGDEGVTSVTNLKIRFGCEFDEEAIDLYGDDSVYDYGMVIVKTADLEGLDLTEVFADLGFSFEELKDLCSSAKQGTWDKMASNNSSGNPDFGCTLSYKDLTNATQMNTEWSVIFYVVDDSGNYVITDAGSYSMKSICENKVNDNNVDENLKEVFQYILDQFQK